MNYTNIFSDQELKSRTDKLMNLDVEFAIIFNRPDLFYYSNIGIDGIITIDTKKKEILRYVKRNLALAKSMSNIEVKEMESFRLFKKIGKKIDTLGLELDILPYKTVNYISKAFDNPKLVDISPKLREIRSIKSKEELGVLKKAIKQTDESFAHAYEKLRPGMTELELAIEIEKFLRKEYYPGYIHVRAFQHNMTSPSYVMSGESISTLNTKFGPISGAGFCRLHMVGPSTRKIKENDVVLIDTTGIFEGYTADESRTFILGNVDKRLIDAIDVSKEVHHKTEKLLVNGANPSEVYFQLNELVKEYGILDNFMGFADDKVQFIGHGIGLELDEFPIITPGYKNNLQNGQIIAMEPKFIFPDLKTGVGLEDDWLVQDNKAIKLTHFPWDNYKK